MFNSSSKITTKQFLASHRKRCFVLTIFSFTLFYFLFTLTVANMSPIINLKKFDLSQLTTLQFWLVQIVVCICVLLILPTIRKLVYPMTYYSGLQGCIFGFFGAIIYYMYEEHCSTLSQYAVFFSVAIFLTCYIYFIIFLIKIANATKQYENTLDFLKIGTVDKVFDYIISGNGVIKNERVLVIYGENGVGKSHVLKILSNKLEDAGKEVYYFYPSLYSNESMKLEFYKKLENILTKKNFLPSLSFFSNSFAKMIETAEQRFRVMGFVQGVVNPVLFGKTLEVSEVLRFYNEETKNVVLCIDELDRCTSEQVQSVLAILRNLGHDFSFNIILTFTNEMEAQIKEETKQVSREGIFEKIAAFYFYIPPFSSIEVKAYLKSYIENKKSEIIAKEQNIILSAMDADLARLLHTPRLINLFYVHLESFIKDYSTIWDENKDKNTQHNEIIFWIAISILKPNCYSELIRTFVHERKSLNQTLLGSSQRFAKKESEKNIFEDTQKVLETHFKELIDIEKLLIFLKDIKKSYWLELYIDNLKFYPNLQADKIEDGINYLNTMMSYYDEFSIRESNKRSISLQVARAIEIYCHDRPMDVIVTLLKEISTHEKSEILLSSIFTQFPTDVKNRLLLELHEKYNKDLLISIYKGIWWNERYRSYDFSTNNDFSVEVRAKILENIISDYNWHALNTLLSLDSIKKDKTIVQEVFKEIFERVNPDKLLTIQRILYILASNLFLNYYIDTADEFDTFLSCVLNYIENPPKKLQTTDYDTYYNRLLSAFNANLYHITGEFHKIFLEFIEKHIIDNATFNTFYIRLIDTIIRGYTSAFPNPDKANHYIAKHADTHLKILDTIDEQLFQMEESNGIKYTELFRQVKDRLADIKNRKEIQ